jgi:Cu2+-exporting ATPase
MKHMIIRKILPVLNLHCAACAQTVANALNSLPGVVQADVNLATAELTVEYDSQRISLLQLRKAVQDKGFDLLLEEDNADRTLEEIQAREHLRLKKRTCRAIILSVPVVIIGMFFMEIPFANEWMWALSTPVIFGLGKDFFVRAWAQIRRRSANMDTLVALSTGVAYLFSVFNTLFPSFWHEKGMHPHVYFEATSVIITFILLGRYLEDRARNNTASVLKKLMGLQPKTLTRIGEDGQQEQTTINTITVGNTILVKPGEKIAVDGTVIAGHSYVDESMLSGEPLPLLKQEHDRVYAGSINQQGSFRFKAEKVGEETMLAQMIRTVREAQGSKAPIQHLADKIAAFFVPVVMAIALLAFVAWLLLDKEHGATHGVLAFVTVLIVACPCALGLAVPTAIIVGVGKAATRGILIKDAASLETAKKITAVVLDKTGTITEGKPVVTAVHWTSGDDSKKAILRALEEQSEHPLAEAIVQYFKETPGHPVTGFESITGKGVQGFADGEMYFVGNTVFLADNGIHIDEQLAATAYALGDRAKTIIWFADAQSALAFVALEDRIKDTSPAAIRQLKASGITLYMLTGDHARTAKAVATHVGIDCYQSEMQPQQKAHFIRQLQAEGKTVAMVGDGINDSAALAQADLSIAMGKGSDIAMDVAGMTIISSDLSQIAVAIHLSKQTGRVIRQNLFWASVYNLLGIPVAAGLLYAVNGFLLNPMIAGGAMALSSLSVVANSLSLRWRK